MQRNGMQMGMRLAALTGQAKKKIAYRTDKPKKKKPPKDEDKAWAAELKKLGIT